MSHNNCHVVPIEKTVTDEELENTQHLILMVQGMGCVNCAMRVRNNLFALKGVAQVEVSHFTAAANIRFNPDLVTLKQLFEAIANAGNDGRHVYKAVAVLTPESAASLTEIKQRDAVLEETSDAISQDNRQ